MAPDDIDVSRSGPPVPASRATRTSYDAIPYQSAAFSQTHPDRLATLARMFGLSPPDVTACRVLELGCAGGGNLIPMAVNLPDSEFVGIDLSQRQVDEANDAVGALGLRNIRIEQASILDVDEGWGQFDYLLCHGVFSWVETAVQDKILQIASANLSPDGIAYISYNTYPGWHMRDMVRHMMRYHAGQFEEPAEQIEQARALLAFLASASQGSGPYGELLTREVDRLGRAEDSYLFHEHLEQTNTPLYFHQFVERAERAGLQYLSEASVSDMLTSRFPESVAATLERISPDILHLEQYMDFVRNRLFRQTLQCELPGVGEAPRAEKAETERREPQRQRIRLGGGILPHVATRSENRKRAMNGAVRHVEARGEIHQRHACALVDERLYDIQAAFDGSGGHARVRKEGKTSEEKAEEPSARQ